MAIRPYNFSIHNFSLSPAPPVGERSLSWAQPKGRTAAPHTDGGPTPRRGRKLKEILQIVAFAKKNDALRTEIP